MEDSHRQQAINARGGTRSTGGNGGGLRNTESKPGEAMPQHISNRRGGTNGTSRQAWRERKLPTSQEQPPSLPAHQFVSSEFARLSMSTTTVIPAGALPQLAQGLLEKLQKGEMECMICYDMIGRNARVWSCSGCYSIFHLTCIRKWARAPTSVDQSGNWRCPGCQAIQLSPANDLQYWCFCGQQLEPPVDFYLTPHSCGGTCKKPLDKSKLGLCQHICTLQCHPGPCPPCAAFALPEACGCGRKVVTRRCIERDEGVVSCGYQCGGMLSCGRHYCTRVCHKDECGGCKVVVAVACFCRRKLDRVVCGQVPVPGDVAGNGIFSCGSICGKLLPCGNHVCSRECHPGDCGDCELSPESVSTCPCKKTTLRALRRSCLDPVPTCGQECGKYVSCGRHECINLCHLGPCPPCEVLVEQKCRCGASSRVVPCNVATSTSDEHSFICDKKCEKKRNCGRHRCNVKCCPSDSGDNHFCMLECGKKLRCGEHFCQELCHSGHCRPCLQSSFTDLSCACGKSSIPPPVPCGTPRPRCDFLCLVPQPCGHPATHTCHFGECPPCTVLVAKECVGQHVTMRNVPCGSREIKCNRPCGKLRKCGVHPCGKTCHSDPCDSDDSSSLSCGQVCGASRRECSHTCVAACHPGSPCPDVRCEFMETITCSCERLTAAVPCEMGGAATRDKAPASQRKLSCDDDCVKTQRLKSLADALGIETNGDPLTAYGSSDCVQEMAKRDSQFVTAVEDRFKYLLLGPKSVACVTGLRVHVFAPLPKDKREVIYQLAQRWNLSSSSVGWEARRYLVVHVNSKSKMPGRLIKLNVVAPLFNPGLDVDPKLVVALLDLPGEGDISRVVLRFAGECELIWLNDRNAITIFTDPSRAATALKRVDHATPYHGAFVLPLLGSGAVVHKQLGWGAPSSSSARAPSPPRAHGHRGDEAKVEEPGRGVWLKRNPVTLVSNPWKALEQDKGSSSSGSAASGSVEARSLAAKAAEDDQNVVDDWETAYD
ncbi:NF-X1-type zinc finger protein NFXL1 [Selaginella moellendorffii]|nr:NF-X1-type zinc finger protein NFXL1 [Selaginella moellendorffii]|eukprot:XP_002969132.2 NF-X1-type zinc finger protein NFXL1 [Selaginella moellendorffii]